jgi:RNA polymerase sigma factor (sigma-70 family)
VRKVSCVKRDWSREETQERGGHEMSESETASGGGDHRHPRFHVHKTMSAKLDALLEEARPRLLRLARLNGISADLAEDMVQDTCLEAWRHLEQLREPERFTSWLDGICRNVCRRQVRAFAGQALQTRLGTVEDEAILAGAHLRDLQAFDPTEELDRQDLHLLVDRALGHLSAGAREVVELCYLAELPQREVAERLEMSLGALELKLHRARRRLRQVLTGALRTDAEEFGLLLNQDESMGWRETRRWCPLCGKHRLRGAFDRHAGGEVAMRLRCPDCSARYGFDLSGSGDIISFAGMRSFQPAMKHAMRAACDFFSAAVHHRVCETCRSTVRVQLVARQAALEDMPVTVLNSVPLPLLRERSCLLVECPRCGYSAADLVNGLLWEPADRAFLLDRPRVITLPDILATYSGQDAICSRLVDLQTDDELTIMAHPHSLEVMAVLRH